MNPNYFFFTILIALFFIPLQQTSTEQETNTFHSRNYDDTDLGDGTHIWTSHGDYILDGWTYKPYLLSETANVVQVKSAQGSIVFDKNACAVTFYNLGQLNSTNKIIGSDSYTVLGTTVGSQNFIKVNSLNNAQCQTTITKDGNDITIIGTKHVDGVGEFKVKYFKPAGERFKTQLEATNLNAAWTNHKLGLTQTIHVPNIITLGDTTYDLRNYNNTILDRTWIQNHKANLITLANKIQFDFGISFKHVDSIQISWDGTNTKLALNYWLNTPKISPFQTLVIDPVFGYVTGSDYDAKTNDTTAASCGTPTTAGTTNIWELRNSAANTYCTILAKQWETTTIPDIATINNVRLRVDQGGTNPIETNMTSIQFQPSTASAVTRWNDILNGTDYIFNNATTITTANNVVYYLPSSANTDLQNLLLSNWFAIGMHPEDMTRPAGINRDMQFANAELEVTYSILTGPPAITASPVVNIINLSFIPNGTTTSYRIDRVATPNSSTCTAGPFTTLVTDTGNNDTRYTDTDVTEGNCYSYQVYAYRGAAQTATGSNKANATIFDITSTNTNMVEIAFERININSSALRLNVTYTTPANLTCNFHYAFAGTNRSYTNIPSIIVDSTHNESSFLIRNSDREIITTQCDDVNSNATGSYIITQTSFPLQDQIEDFRDGDFGTAGKIGALDLVTLIIIIVAMVGLNRVNESVGGVFMVIIVGVMSYFGFVNWVTFFSSALAVGLLWAISTTRKN